jgi:hypothetical protein
MIEPLNIPWLSQSIAWKLIQLGPEHAFAAHPKIGGEKSETSDAMDLGSLVDALVFGHKVDEFSVVDAKDYKTKAARAARDAAIEAGKRPVLSKVMRKALKLAEAVASYTVQGRSQERLKWIDPDYGVPCQGTPDVVAMDGAIQDLKTCDHIGTARSLSAHSMRYGYHVQAAAYLEGVQEVYPDLAGRCHFRWLFAESRTVGGKHVVREVFADPTFIELGRREWDRAKRLWRDLHTGATQPATTLILSAPLWAIQDSGLTEDEE